MGSFFRTLKVEDVYMSDYKTYDDVLASTSYFIEEMYNKKRLHSPLGYMPRKNLKINLIKTSLVSWS
jgi:putative transposase